MRGLVASFQQALLNWFDANRRDLPWRRPPGDLTSPLSPYAVLVSEAMLQQTQVATVVDYFRRWMARFPTLRSLADADEQDVLRLWQGLGYYNRARNLHRAARHIVGALGGRFPDTVDGLRELPGVGPYSAGAIASIAFDRPVPLVDGNVQRVLVRLDARQLDPRSVQGKKALWARAAELVPTTRPGDFNSALMELGATVCAPRKPRCLTCPVARFCEAAHAGIAESIPPPKPARPLPSVRRTVFCLLRPDGRWLIEQRPATGRWAGLWQFPAREPGSDQPPCPAATPADRLKSITHTLTHRRYTFEPLLMRVNREFTWACGGRKHAWVTLDEVAHYPLPKPHVVLAGHLRSSIVPAPSERGTPRPSGAPCRTGLSRPSGSAPASGSSSGVPEA